MNNQQKNQAISDACPGRFFDRCGAWSFLTDEGEFVKCHRGSIVEDLNAIRFAAKTLDINELTEYADELDKICVPVHVCPLTHWLGVVESDSYQRAEAFGRVKELW